MSGPLQRVLFLGENWWGSSARACAAALRRLGMEVAELDVQTVMPSWRGGVLRAARRALRAQIVAEYNRQVDAALRAVNPDCLFAFKGAYLYRSTLESARERGVFLLNYFPDNSAAAHGPELQHSLETYDLVCAAHAHVVPQLKAMNLPGVLAHVAHGYDADVHVPPPRVIGDFAVDVAFVGSHSPGKEKLLAELLGQRPKLDLAIWGDRWDENLGAGALRRYLRGSAVTGQRYARAVSEPAITLGLTSEAAPGATHGDSVTTRSVEIPACGGFLLHQRNPEIGKLYREGEEIACFDGAEELALQVDRYLGDAAERERIRKNGYARCVPSYSYDERMAELLRLPLLRGGRG